MAAELAVGYVSVVPEVSGFARILARALANVENQFGDVGRDAGQRFVRGVDGRLRDSLTGKFVAEGQEAGQGFAEGAESGAGGAGGLQGKLGGIIGGLGVALAGAATAAGAAIGAAMYTGITNAMEEQAGSGRLQAQLGLSDSEAAAAGRTAGQVYGDNFGGSLEEARVAVGAVLSSIGDNLGDAGLEGVTEQALTFADVFEVDVTEAATVAGVAINNNLARDGTHAFDLLTAASQQMPASLRAELLPAIEEYGTFFDALGLSGEEAFGLLAAQDNLQAIDKVGDGLKELTIRATDMSTASVDAYGKAGLNAEDMAARFVAGGDTARGALDDLVDGLLGIEDPTERANAAIALFGTPLEDMNVSEIPEFLTGLDNMGSALGDVSGVTDKAAEDTAKGLGPWIESMKRQAILGASNFFTGIGEAFSSGGMEGVGEHLQGMWEENWPRFQAGAQTLFERLKTWIVTEGPGVAQRIGDAIYAGGNWLIQNWPAFAGKMLEFYGRIGNWIATVGAPKLGEWLKTTGGPALWQWIQDAVPPLLQKLAEMYGRLTVWLVTVGVPWLAATGARLWAALGEWLWTEAVPALLRGLGSMINSLAIWFDGTAVPWLRQKSLELWGWLVSTAREKGPELLAWLATLPGIIGGFITGTAIPALRQKAAEWFASLAIAAKEKANDLMGTLAGIPGAAIRALGDLGSTLISAGRELIGGLIDGIQDAIPDLDGVLGGITDRIPDWKGPAERDKRLLRPTGQMIMDGLMAGIADQVVPLRSQLQAITGGIAGTDFGRPRLALPARGAVAGATSRPVELVVNLDGRVLHRSVTDIDRQMSRAS